MAKRGHHFSKCSGRSSCAQIVHVYKDLLRNDSASGTGETSNNKVFIFNCSQIENNYRKYFEKENIHYTRRLKVCSPKYNSALKASGVPLTRVGVGLWFPFASSHIFSSTSSTITRDCIQTCQYKVTKHVNKHESELSLSRHDLYRPAENSGRLKRLHAHHIECCEEDNQVDK